MNQLERLTDHIYFDPRDPSRVFFRDIDAEIKELKCRRSMPSYVPDESYRPYIDGYFVELDESMKQLWKVTELIADHLRKNEPVNFEKIQKELDDAVE